MTAEFGAKTELTLSLCSIKPSGMLRTRPAGVTPCPGRVLRMTPEATSTSLLVNQHLTDRPLARWTVSANALDHSITQTPSLSGASGSFSTLPTLRGPTTSTYVDW